MCFPDLKIILQIRPSVFKFNLKWTVIFLHKNFRICNRRKQGELVPTCNFPWKLADDFAEDKRWGYPKWKVVLGKLTGKGKKGD